MVSGTAGQVLECSFAERSPFSERPFSEGLSQRDLSQRSFLRGPFSEVLSQRDLSQRDLSQRSFLGETFNFFLRGPFSERPLISFSEVLSQGAFIIVRHGSGSAFCLAALLIVIFIMMTGVISLADKQKQYSLRSVMRTSPGTSGSG